MPQEANPHLRWHPLRGEWVAYAAYRQGRTFLPPAEYNPLAPTRDPAHPTELPAGDYDIAVFDNRFPTLALSAHDPPDLTVATAPASGQCEVVVFAQDAGASLGTLPVSHIVLLLQAWAGRTQELAKRPRIAYVLPFENRGAEVGVTLHHPHGQIYAYPFVPPVPARMLAQERAYFAEHGQALLVDMARREADGGTRVLYLGTEAIAFVPACARYPYEAWVMPRRQTDSFAALSVEQREDLARALKTVLLKYDGLWQREMPYLMAWYQAPTDGRAHPETQLHAQFYPPVPHARTAQIPGRYRVGRRHVRHGCPARGVGAAAAASARGMEYGRGNRMNWNVELEIAHKLAQMRGWLEQERAGAVRLRGVDWFAWATAGASGSAGHSAECGCAEVLVTRDAAYILTDAAEAQRLRQEEVRGSWTWQVTPWMQPRLAELREHFVQHAAGGRPVLCDRPGLQERCLPVALRAERLSLLAPEQARYREVGRLAAAAASEALRAARPDWSEQDLAGACARALWSRGLHAVYVLAAGAERFERYRRAPPAASPLGERAVWRCARSASACAPA